MARRNNREAIDDMEDELVRALRRWCRRPTDEAMLKFQSAMSAYRRAFLGDDDPPAGNVVEGNSFGDSSSVALERGRKAA